MHKGRIGNLFRGGPGINLVKGCTDSFGNFLPENHMPYYPPMFHSHAEIIHILSGKLRVSVNGIQKDLLAGDTSITLPYVIHTYEKTEDFEAIVLMFDPSVANLYEKKLITYKRINPFISQNDDIPMLLKKYWDFMKMIKKTICSQIYICKR